MYAFIFFKWCSVSPNGTGGVIRKHCFSFGLVVSVLPRFRQLLAAERSLHDIRDVPSAWWSCVLLRFRQLGGS